MGQIVTSLAGTAEGHRIAVILAIVAAFLHALFGALQKGRDDPWLARAAIDACYGVMALPVALFLVPWPTLAQAPIFAGAFVIHAGYKIAQAMTYDRAPYTVAYPIVRGTGPVFTVIFAGAVFGEAFAPGQWAGLGLLVAGIFGLSVAALTRMERPMSLAPALALALLTGGFVAAYTTYDAWGIRAVEDPFTFLAWFFVVDSLFIPALTWRRWQGVDRARLGGLAARGVFGALVAFASFGSVMIATRLDHVGLAAALRETSVVFAALIGWLVLGEKVGWLRGALMGLIALGAVMMEVAA
ncbi:DMT family transporter [Rhodobacter sp. KR11]|uniref:DMT family transporter n=1 Tax=Rhodobacter sp. KR11 TaxID=2974588 RepID=UPI002222CF1D|nr:DMT family transporter [Rhodobacter sp. KR11]MCW1917593.1 DMT family transporter [Rhodobacter sp. KR11]